MKKVIRENGSLLFDIDGQKIHPAAYMSYCPAFADYTGFYNIGYRLFSYCIYASDVSTNEETGLNQAWEKSCWPAEDVFDFSALDAGMRRITGEHYEKEAWVILRVNINMPTWWRKKHPEELMHYADGRVLMQSISSLRWRTDAERFLTALKQHMETAGYASHVIAWQIAAMQTEEWLYPNRFLPQLQQDAPFLAALQQWCRARYPDIAALNTAWQTDYASFDELQLPTEEIYRQKQALGCAMPAFARAKDFFECLSNANAETIQYFAALTKRLHGGDILTGVFYGYIAQCSEISAHNAIGRLLNDANIDFFASPFAYVQARGPGVDWIYHAPMQAVDVADKLWFLESDVRTNLTRHLRDVRPELFDADLPYFNHPVFFGPKETRQCCNNILRSFAKFFISQHAYWWFDMWGGWYDSGEYMQLHKKLLDIYREKTTRTVKNNSQVALVLDENASYYTSGEGFVRCVHESCVQLGYLGAPYDLLLLDRLTPQDIARYKLFVFTAPAPDPAAFTQLKACLTAAGKQILVTGEGPDCDCSRWDAALARDKAQKAGVFLYSPGNIVYANENYLAITAAADGPVTLHIPTGKALCDLLTGEKLPPAADGSLQLPMAFNDCRLFRLI